MKELEREVRELKRANEILRKAAAFLGCFSPLAIYHPLSMRYRMIDKPGQAMLPDSWISECRNGDRYGDVL